MTQHETIKIMLEDGQWVCGTEFLKEFIPEYRSRINEWRKEGVVIEARPCRQHEHRSKTLQEWRLVSKTINTSFPTLTSKLTRVESQIHRAQPLFSFPNTYKD